MWVDVGGGEEGKGGRKERRREGERAQHMGRCAKAAVIVASGCRDVQLLVIFLQPFCKFESFQSAKKKKTRRKLKKRKASLRNTSHIVSYNVI